MNLRLLKIVFVDFVALLCIIYAIHNVVNLEACFQAFAYVFSQVDHVVYPGSIVPVIQNSALIWLALVIVIALEFLAGMLAAKGAWDMWSARNAAAGEFNSAKKYALLGCSVGIVVWFGLFGVFGGALFQMLQTEIGAGSMDNAFQFFVSCALIFVLLNSPDQ